MNFEDIKSSKSIRDDIEAVNQISIVPTLLDVVCQTTGMGFAAIARVTEDQWVTCSVRDDISFGLKPGDELKIKTTICDEIRQNVTPVIIDHVAIDPHFSTHHTPLMYGFQSYISVPIILKNGSFFGTLCAIDPNPRELNTPAIKGMFDLFADLISLHLHAIDQVKISEAKVLEERLLYKKIEENEEKLNIVIEASELGIWEVNLKTKEIQYSDRFFSIMGYKERLNLTLDDTRKQIYPGETNLRDEAFKRAFETGNMHYKGRIIWPDQSVHWVETKGKVIYDEQHEPVYIKGTIRDITEDKIQEQVLLESEQKFRLLADSMPQHVWTADPEGKLNYYNQAILNYSGLPLEKIKKGSWINIVHPDDAEANMKEWMACVRTGKDYIFEHRFRRHDGEYRWQLSRAVPQKDEQGNIQMWVGTSTDIQDQKIFTDHLERQVYERTQQLKENNFELEKMNKELQSFAYVASHDLQEPLRKIQTFANRLVEKENQHLSDQGKDYFKRMLSATVRMQQLINDLLAFSRINTTERKFELVDLKDIVEEVKADLKEVIDEKNAVIEFSNLCSVNIIPFQFRQLIYNLLSNALKFSKQDIPPHIVIACSNEKGNDLISIKSDLPSTKLSLEKSYSHISVKDNGIGFDPQFKERIFEVFQRLHGKSEYVGTGIGLAIVKKIVDNHDGIIEATSEVNEGAIFDVYIPQL